MPRIQRRSLRWGPLSAAAIVTALIAGAVGGFPGSSVSAHADQAEDSTDEWPALQAKLSGITGVWTDQSYRNAVTTGMPDTALLGNGDVGVVSGGGEGYKRFYVTKGDFWSGNGGVAPAGLGSVTIKPSDFDDGNSDLARGANALASSTHDSFSADRAVNGQWGQGYEGWVSQVGKPQWLSLDLGEAKEVARYVLRFDSAARPGNEVNDAKDFRLQSSDNGSDWVDRDVVTGNSSGVVDKTVTPFTARYLRAYFDTPTQETTDDSIQNTRARVGAFELYQPQSDLARGANALASSTHDSFSVDRAVNGQWGQGYEGWVSQVGKPQWLSLDLGEAKEVARYVLRFDSAARPGNEVNDAKDFRLQSSDNGSDWVDRDVVTGNSSGVVDKTVTPFTARYLRAYFDTPTQETTDDSIQNTRARVGAFELYAQPGTPPTGPSPEFRETQNIVDATVDTDMTLGASKVSMNTWVAANDNIVVTQLTSHADAAAELRVELASGAGSPRPGSESTAGADGSTLWADRSTNPNGSGWVSRAAMATRLLGTDFADIRTSGSKTTATFTVQPGQTVQIVTAVGGGGRDTSGERAAAESLVGGMDDQGVIDHKSAHAAWWKNYWLKSYVNLGDPKLERYYYGALYHMGSASREGKLAPGIFGIWATQDNSLWDGDYHLNYNAQAPFYGVYSANRPELALPFYDVIDAYVPEAADRARTDLARLIPTSVGMSSRPDLANGIDDALLFPVGIGPWGSTTVDDYYHQTLNGLFNATQYIDYYDYTLDRGFLSKEMYPYLLRVATFFEKYLQWDAAKNEYFMWSAHHEGTWAKNSSPDIGMLKKVLSSIIDGSRTLDVDASRRATWQHILDHLPAAPTTTYQGKTVYSLAEPGMTTSPEGGGNNDTRDIRPGDQPVNLEFIAPGDQIGINSTEAEKQIARDSLAAMDSWSNDNAFPKVYTIAARVGWDPSDIITRMDGEIDRLMAPNLRIRSDYHGIEKSGAIEAINDMLVQTSKGVTNVFANWPATADASFNRLRLPGAFTISAARTAGSTGPVSITSDKGGQMNLRNPWTAPRVSVTTAEGAPVDFAIDAGVISFSTNAGESYVVKQAESLAATTAPSIAGSARVGSTLLADPGTWNVAGLEYHFAWLRDGSPVTGADDRSYGLRAADAGATISVAVTASRSGFADATATSAGVGPVADSPPGSNPSLRLSANSVQAGEPITISGTAFAPDERVAVELHSDVVQLGKAQAGPSGAFDLTATVPKGTPAGNHLIVVTGEKSGSVSIAITVIAKKATASGNLSSTGIEAGLTLLIAVAIIAVGIFTLAARRRRTKQMP